MSIRKLQPDDAAEYQALRLSGLAEAPSAFASSHEEEAHTPLAEMARRLSPSESGAIFGAFAEGRLVGVVGVQRESMRKLSHKAVIWGMYVEPSQRRCGHASRLLAHGLSYAWQSLGVVQVNLGVHTENTRAISLYSLFGFTVWGTEPGALVVDGQAQDEHHMVCRAPPAA